MPPFSSRHRIGGEKFDILYIKWLYLKTNVIEFRAVLGIKNHSSLWKLHKKYLSLIFVIWNQGWNNNPNVSSSFETETGSRPAVKLVVKEMYASTLGSGIWYSLRLLTERTFPRENCTLDLGLFIRSLATLAFNVN